MRPLRLYALVMGTAAALAACGGGTGNEGRQAEASGRVSFRAQNLAPLETGHYEGWVIAGDQKVSFGRFGVSEDGGLVDMSGAPLTEFRTAQRVPAPDAFAITIEPDGDADAIPSGVIVLFGKAANGRAALAFDAVDLESLSGRFILGTPTDDPAKNETAGVWFVDPRNPSKLAPSLDLPDAPDGWVYEGWAVHRGRHPISTGRFASVRGADAFRGYSGKKAGPPFPGEDLIRDLPFGLAGPLRLDDGTSKVVVSLEPDIDGTDPTGSGPFQLKPLVGDVPSGAKDHVLLPLTRDLAGVPTGTAALA